jgi:predicted PurR-regulated permease PerM
MPATKQTTSSALIAMASVVITSFVVAALYVGQDILIPIALAVLLSFLLTPIVTRLERWIGRVCAVMLAVAVLFALVGGVGWVLTTQVLDLATRLPDYKENIQLKLRSLKKPSGRFDKLSATVEELKKDLPGAAAEPEPKPEPTDAPESKTEITVAVPEKPLGNGLPQAAATGEALKPVEVVETKHVGPIERIAAVLSPVLGPLGTGALVLLLLICILLQREDLRGRMIRLIGKGNITTTTRAMDDAAQRVARYLLMQFIVNATYGSQSPSGSISSAFPARLPGECSRRYCASSRMSAHGSRRPSRSRSRWQVTKDWTMPLYTVGTLRGDRAAEQ